MALGECGSGCGRGAGGRREEEGRARAAWAPGRAAASSVSRRVRSGSAGSSGASKETARRSARRFSASSRPSLNPRRDFDSPARRDRSIPN